MTDHKYDSVYSEGPEALGPPTDILVKFLSAELTTPIHVLDVGAGQGRDAIWLAQAGHRVTAIDLSKVGIAQLAAQAAADGLAIEAQIGDAESFTPSEPVDCVLLDRTLHMILDKARREAAFVHLCQQLVPGGLVVVLDEKNNLPGMLAKLPDWQNIWSPQSGFALRRPI